MGRTYWIQYMRADMFVRATPTDSRRRFLVDRVIYSESELPDDAALVGLYDESCRLRLLKRPRQITQPTTRWSGRSIIALVVITVCILFLGRLILNGLSRDTYMVTAAIAESPTPKPILVPLVIPTPECLDCGRPDHAIAMPAARWRLEITMPITTVVDTCDEFAVFREPFQARDGNWVTLFCGITLLRCDNLAAEQTTFYGGACSSSTWVATDDPWMVMSYRYDKVSGNGN